MIYNGLFHILLEAEFRVFLCALLITFIYHFDKHFFYFSDTEKMFYYNSQETLLEAHTCFLF